MPVIINEISTEVISQPAATRGSGESGSQAEIQPEAPVRQAEKAIRLLVERLNRVWAH